MAQFCDDGLDVWFADLQWAWNEDKTRSLLLDVFSRRKRFSQVQGRLWRRVIALYWKSGWTARQIGDQFGVSLKNIRRIIQTIRREAARFFGQALQPREGQALQSEKPKPAPIVADPTNESQAYWESVLASHGLFNPDKRAKGWTRKNPIVKFEWQSATSVHAEGWSAFYENETRPKPGCHTLQKTGGSGSWGKSKQIGTRTTEIDGKSHDVRVFETGRACTLGWNTNPRRNAGSPADKGYLAHTVTNRAIDGDREAREYLQEYEELEAQKYANPRGFLIIPGIEDPCEGRPIIQDFIGAQTSRGTDVWIDTDGTVYKRGSNQACGHLDTTISSDETTRTAFQIGHAEPNVRAIPSRDNFVADVEEQHNFFIEDESKKDSLYSRTEVIRIIKDREIPKGQLADIARVPPARLSDYLRNRGNVTDEQAERIAEAVTNILLVWKTFAPIKIALDDPQAFAKAVELANVVHARLAAEIADEAVLDGMTLRMKSIESGTAAD